MTRCQSCHSADVKELLDLGSQPICNAFHESPEELEVPYPLRLGQCADCFLVQLMEVLPREIVFGENFNYLSGSSPDVVRHYYQLADHVSEKYNKPRILEIASNDGTFLERARTNGCEVLGVDPAPEAVKIALRKGIPSILGYFEDIETGFSPDVICAFDVFGHAENIHPMLKKIRELMKDETTLIVQNQSLSAMVETTAWDTIYHEHLRYFDLYSFSRLIAPYGLRIDRYQFNDFYGGSVVVHCKIGKRAIMGLPSSTRNHPEYLMEFARRARQNAIALRYELFRQKDLGKRIVGVGAPMKSSTLLNFCGLGPGVIDYLTEVNPLKIGKYAPGSKIPVVEEDRIFRDQPELALILSWNMKDSIMKKLISGGYKGDFLIPIPEPKMIANERILIQGA